MSKHIVLKWMDGDKKREGRFLQAIDRDGQTDIVIYGTDGLIYRIRAEDIKPI